VSKTDRVPYITGALTELAEDIQAEVKKFYVDIADVCLEVIGVRGFVPHEHFDPIKHRDFTPPQVDASEREQVTKKSSFLIVVAIEPTWGGGIEVEMANNNGVPIILLCPKDKLDQRRISRLLRGNPAIHQIITYENFEGALTALREFLPEIVGKLS